MEWWSIEVLDGTVSAARWKDAYSWSLIASAIANGAVDWVWHEHRWGVVFEVAFTEQEQWEAFRELPGVQAALDAVPDRVNGLLVYRGRGGSAGTSVPRRPRPQAGAGAIALPEPDPESLLEDSLEAGPMVMDRDQVPDRLTAAKQRPRQAAQNRGSARIRT